MLQLWKKYEFYAESKGVLPEQPRSQLNPWIREQKEQNTDLLNDKRCAPMRSNCLRKPDRKNTGAIQRYSQDGTPMKNTGVHFLTSEGENTTLFCTTGSPWRSTCTSLQELKDKIRNIGFLRQMQKEKLSNHSINDTTLLKRKENANDCTTSFWQRPKKNTEPFLAFNK